MCEESEFRARVTAALASGLSARKIADEFEAAVSTVHRWASGIARPGPNVRAAVVRWLDAQPKSA